MGINKVILVGNVGRDPEFRNLQSGTAIATFSLATTDKRSKDEDGNPRTEWHNIVMWGKLAEICQRYVTKGKQLYLEGQIRTRNYEKDGQKKYFTEIHAFTMEMLGGRGDQGPRVGDAEGPPWGDSSPSGGGDGGDGGDGGGDGGDGGGDGGGSGFPSDADDIPF